ncbi:hypothetical protein EC991_003901 [Linnemannia zychae]|nr:hypothetical protein EC991_003901 [Linnemannia zychae]
MSNLSTVYKELLESNEGDVLIKLKDGKQLKVISYLVKNRSSIFKIMLESSMKEAITGEVDLSSQYTLEAFREVMAYIYYDKMYTGSYVPLLFEILTITDYYGLDVFRAYIIDKIMKLITDVPICLVIAAEAQKHGTLTGDISSRCLGYLVGALKGVEVSVNYSMGRKVQKSEERIILDIDQLPNFIVEHVKTVMNNKDSDDELRPHPVHILGVRSG